MRAALAAQSPGLGVQLSSENANNLKSDGNNLDFLGVAVKVEMAVPADVLLRGSRGAVYDHSWGRPRVPAAGD